VFYLVLACVLRFATGISLRGEVNRIVTRLIIRGDVVLRLQGLGFVIWSRIGVSLSDQIDSYLEPDGRLGITSPSVKLDKGVSQMREHWAQIGIGNGKQVYIIHVRRIAWTRHQRMIYWSHLSQQGIYLEGASLSIRRSIDEVFTIVVTFPLILGGIHKLLTWMRSTWSLGSLASSKERCSYHCKTHHL
jgi:hypothetical protein